MAGGKPGRGSRDACPTRLGRGRGLSCSQPGAVAQPTPSLFSFFLHSPRRLCHAGTVRSAWQTRGEKRERRGRRQRPRLPRHPVLTGDTYCLSIPTPAPATSALVGALSPDGDGSRRIASGERAELTHAPHGERGYPYSGRRRIATYSRDRREREGTGRGGSESRPTRS